MELTLFIGAEHRASDSMQQRLAEHIEQVRLARELGFDSVVIGSHFSYGSTAWFPPIETLMRLAAVADGMSLGTCMLVLPLFHPVQVAEQFALLDAASGGRAINQSVGYLAFGGRALPPCGGRLRDPLSGLQRNPTTSFNIAGARNACRPCRNEPSSGSDRGRLDRSTRRIARLATGRVCDRRT
jgi:hypothetical protein